MSRVESTPTSIPSMPVSTIPISVNGRQSFAHVCPGCSLPFATAEREHRHRENGQIKLYSNPTYLAQA